MRIVHISDTHLGFFAYSRTDPDTGINQREADFYRVFAQAVDMIIDLKPDAVVHAGDLFDGVRPQNRAIDTALRQLIRLSEAGIEVVLISGNHSTPKMRETGSIFRIFDHLDGIHPIYEPGVTEVISGDIAIHAIPHSVEPPMKEVLSTLRPSDKTRYNILVLHAGIEGSARYRTDHINQQMIAPESIPSGFDYVALGHYHECDEVGERMWYSGSTERLSFGEVGQRKGFIEVDLDRGTTTFHELHTRSMLDLQPVDASGMSGMEIINEVGSRLAGVALDGAIARLSVKNVPPEGARALDVPSLKRRASGALHFDLKIERADNGTVPDIGNATIGSLEREYGDFVARLELTDEKRRRMLELGAAYFAEDKE